MAGAVEAIKKLLVPAVISLILFLFLTYALLPAWRRYRNRYSQYIPVDGFSDRTSSIRSRIADRLSRFRLPWSRDRDIVTATDERDHDLSDGEELGNVDEDVARRLEQLSQPRRPDNTRRLSRDLEEGFRDDSSDDSDND
ncbi:hypothetical protein NLU13_9387 [Sarocladium strictum]|uniref:Uncharacterized protein n=1 Tax=Sarocladium strictum TaxID=5046 RepID=A0AA39L3T6_SARSR|nr:hypothetical protein NLU13_9387 [Sarocladium strictum]